jgi:hypothetical protein
MKGGITMMGGKTMTLNLNTAEMEAVETLSKKKGLSKTSLLRQALRVYQAVELRLERGEKLFFEDDKKEKAELVLL